MGTLINLVINTPTFVRNTHACALILRASYLLWAAGFLVGGRFVVNPLTSWNKLDTKTKTKTRLKDRNNCRGRIYTLYLNILYVIWW